MIGIFDSGVGGLTVAKEILKNTNRQQIIYFGDTARLPYGTKTPAFIRKISRKITKWLIKKGAEIIVIACNTSSALAGDTIKREFKAPVFDVISPSIKDVLQSTKNKKVGVIGTPATIKSLQWQKKIKRKDKSIKVYSVSCPLFVPLVEEGWVDKKITKAIAEDYLKPLKEKQIDVLVLACTHYPLLKDTIREVMGKKVKIIDPAKNLAKEINLFLNKNQKSNSSFSQKKNNYFFFSDAPYNFEKISKLCFGRKVKIIKKIEDPFSF